MYGLPSAHMHSPDAVTARHLATGTVEVVSAGRVVAGMVSTTVAGAVAAMGSAVVVTSAVVTGDAVGESSEHAEKRPSNTIAKTATRFSWVSRRRGMP